MLIGDCKCMKFGIIRYENITFISFCSISSTSILPHFNEAQNSSANDKQARDATISYALII